MLAVRKLDPHPLGWSSASAVAATDQVERHPQDRVREGSGGCKKHGVPVRRRRSRQWSESRLRPVPVGRGGPEEVAMEVKAARTELGGPRRGRVRFVLQVVTIASPPTLGTE